MHDFSRSISKLLIFCLTAPGIAGLALAQETRDRRIQSETKKTEKTWSAPPISIAQQATQAPALAKLSAEPVMRIALATNVRSATVSTTAHLLNASQLSMIPLETSRVHVEARALSPRPVANDATNEVQLARGLPREEADNLAALVREKVGEDARVAADESPDKWRVVVSKSSREAAEEARTKLEDAGYETLNTDANATAAPVYSRPTARLTSSTQASVTNTSSIRLTARTRSPNREVVGFTRGATPLLRSSAPVVFASDDEPNGPVRFNDKPYRGRIEVFTNQRGALTVVNVISLEDYVKGVVPNELSPGGYPAIEALKAQAIAARTYAMRNRGQFASEGYDLLPTTRSQVYRGLTSEHSLSSRAVDETRGLVSTYNREPINALYTST